MYIKKENKTGIIRVDYSVFLIFYCFCHVFGFSTCSISRIIFFHSSTILSLTVIDEIDAVDGIILYNHSIYYRIECFFLQTATT